MANPEHVKVLKQGVNVWNKWREENPNIKPDLQDEKLNNMDFRGINFSRTDFECADLSGSNLIDADLKEVIFNITNLTGTKLSNAGLYRAMITECYMEDSNIRAANLELAILVQTDMRKADAVGAKLYGVNFTDSDLRHANFSGSSLSYAKFIRSLMDRTNLTGAYISDTIFGEVNLGGIIGLETLTHWGPSIIDTGSIALTHGNIPEVFLRGCGVSDNFIQYIPSLVNQPIQFYSCFISYSSKDQDFADRLYADLQNKGVRCWFASEDMKIGDKIRDRIDHSIKIHDKLLLILSENSINSEWVEDEVESAYEQEQKRNTTVLFPIRLDDAVMDTEKAWASKLRRSRHVGNFIEWKDHDSYQKSFDRVLKDLKAERE